ncbi:MAG: antibiotic biosynthesis monooxygenase [Chitinophagales bacterium]|nr:antibiotic biosynthesis monooxygenase [Bacteroidota bacterium]MCB9255917.1 antibiotic biosynthesis monooxygenase [Chitinophagales bacterium]
MIAVIFTSQRSSYSQGYEEFNEKLESLANELPGFIQQDSSRNNDGFGISISYWKDEESAKEFKKIALHIEAQEAGRKHYYTWYHVKVCKLIREYGFRK